MDFKSLIFQNASLFTFLLKSLQSVSNPLGSTNIANNSSTAQVQLKFLFTLRSRKRRKNKMLLLEISLADILDVPYASFTSNYLLTTVRPDCKKSGATPIASNCLKPVRSYSREQINYKKCWCEWSIKSLTCLFWKHGRCQQSFSSSITRYRSPPVSQPTPFLWYICTHFVFNALRYKLHLIIFCSVSLALQKNKQN